MSRVNPRAQTQQDLHPSRRARQLSQRATSPPHFSFLGLTCQHPPSPRAPVVQPRGPRLLTLSGEGCAVHRQLRLWLGTLGLCPCLLSRAQGASAPRTSPAQARLAPASERSCTRLRESSPRLRAQQRQAVTQDKTNQLQIFEVCGRQEGRGYCLAREERG